MNLTTTQAAKIAGVNGETIRRWCVHCGLKHSKFDEMFVINKANLEDFLNSGNRSGYGKEVNPTPIYRRAKELQKALAIRRNRRKMEEIIEAGKPAIILKQGERL